MELTTYKSANMENCGSTYMTIDFSKRITFSFLHLEMYHSDMTLDILSISCLLWIDLMKMTVFDKTNNYALVLPPNIYLPNCVHISAVIIDLW